ncbi:hypothetical protein M434DRAFT_85753 [Hypoxylon sp. CO27-5]|nr:hypothetical protein M434DRAFT_85753 [Hypoxylon sp. CO27-5]
MAPFPAESWIPISSIAFIIAIFIPLLVTIVHRIYIHPLRHIPGPRLAAVSEFYGFYYNYIKEGGFSKRFQYLHEKYDSPVIRISPNHVHVNSPEFFEEVFRIGSKYAKDPSFYKHFGGLDSMTDAEKFRTYRTHIASLYSSRSADALVPRLLTELRLISKRLERMVGTDDVVNVQKMFRTLGVNMMLQLIFPQDVNLFGFDEYHPFLRALDIIMTKTWLVLTYPLFGIVLSAIPGLSYAKFREACGVFYKYCESWAGDAQLLHSTREKPVRDSHMTRYQNIDPTNHQKVKAVPHPLEDIFNFIAGGSDTTAYTTSCAIHYLLTSPEVLSRLQAELDESAPFIRDELDHKRIQNLNYLNAVVEETLRLSSPVPGCLPRIVPNGGACVGSIYIPAGTIASVSLLSIHQNTTLFPQPQKFCPERWLGEEGKRLEKWNVAFSRGPRQCIGANIAYLELHACLAYLFSHFEFTLLGNPSKKLEWVDRFIATNVEDVKVRVVKNRWI